MGNTLKKKKGFSMPHVYAVILILMLLVTIMTYVIPAGTYARVDGNVDPNSFTYVEQTPVSFLSFFTSLHQGFVESANVIGAVLLISGAIQIIQKTGAFSAGIQALIKRAKGRDLVMVLLFFTIFTGMGVIGYLDALYPFYPIIISLFITLGYDKMVGTAIIMLSTAVGFTCGMVNPYTTGVAQTLVGLPMYSGIALRAKGMGAEVIVTEIDPFKALDATMNGFRVMPMDEAARYGDIFVTVTGCKDVITPKHFAVMKHNAILTNAGHFDCEVDVAGLAAMAVKREVRRDNIEGFTLPGGRVLNVIGEGRLVNLAAGNGHPAEIMDMSFSVQALALEWLVKHRDGLEKKVYQVPAEIDDAIGRVKLAAMGLSIDALTPEQEEYLNGWKA